MIDGSRLREARRKRGLKQYELAKMTGLSKGSITKYENGNITNIKTETLIKLADTLKVSVDYLLKLKDEDEIDPQSKVRIPVYGSVPAGIPTEALQENEGYIEISESMIRGGKKFAALKVHGDSMYPFYLDGDTVVVELTSDFEDGNDVVVFIGDNYESTLKRIHRKNNYIELEPLNREYQTRKFGVNDKLSIFGVVRELRRNV